MPGTVPQTEANPGHGVQGLELALDALLEVTHAACGWVGVLGPDRNLSFPLRRGLIPAAWLKYQTGDESPWGFALRDGLTLLNDLLPWPASDPAPLKSLLSCPIRAGNTVTGHVTLANKASGFTSDDAAVIQAIAHLMGKLASADSDQREKQPGLIAVPPEVLERSDEGIFMVDEGGVLVFVNATWAEWTGFATHELLGQRAPLPFWIGHRQLAELGPAISMAAVSELFSRETRQGGRSVLPFRRHDDSVFWCQVESRRMEWSGRRWLLAVLRQPAPFEPVRQAELAALRSSLESLLECLPCAALLTNGDGRIVAHNRAAQKQGLSANPHFRDAFALSSAVALEHLMRDPAAAGPERFGRLVLRRATEGSDWVAYWFAVPSGPALAEGGYLFVLSDDWQALFPPDNVAANWLGVAARPAPGWLPLLLRPGQEPSWWDDRWEKLTGLKAGDVAGTAAEVVLDWLFPRQPDRDFVADLLQRPPETLSGGQAILQVLTPGGSEPRPCTFLPIRRGTNAALGDTWLLLVAEPPAASVGAEEPTGRMIRQFAGGLSHLLNVYLMTPTGLAEMALDRGDVPAPFGAWFEQILDSCRQAADLISALQDLAATELGETVVESLADAVRDVLGERPGQASPVYELVTDLEDADALVRVNPRMLRVVLRHLLSNAEHALVNSTERRITVRVKAGDDRICCECEDTGEGLEAFDPTAVVAPFYSTKGPFARDAAHAALPGTGLGLTVCRHLLALHGGRLQLESRPGRGTAAIAVLPRAVPASSAPQEKPAEAHTVRVDAGDEARRPHAASRTSISAEPRK